MLKKLLVVGVICGVAWAFLFWYFMGYPPFRRVEVVSLCDLCRDPEAWVGKKVCVEGVMEGPLIYIPEGAPPYNYLLKDPEHNVSFGVLWPGVVKYHAHVVVVGVVRKGGKGPLIVGPEYYIEAEEVTVSG